MKFLAQTAALAATALLLATGSAFAATTVGLTFAGGCPSAEDDPFCGTAGNADTKNVSLLLGVPQGDVTLIGTIDEDAGSSAFSITGLDDYSGTWNVTDTSITHLAFKADGYYILADIGANTSGTWSTDINDWGDYGDGSVMCPADICLAGPRAYVETDFLDDDGAGGVAKLSNARAFSVVPIPAAVWLFGSGLGLLGWMRRKSIAAS
jgi:hypothetical protein